MSQELDLASLSDGFAALLNPAPAAAQATGAPLEIRLQEIEEDPNQPRTEFDAEALAELAESIRADKVRVPISVRPRNERGTYVINHGARRYRASLIAGKNTIPAFVDDSHDDFAQVVENIQRDGLSPREIAEFISKRRALGDKDKLIGARLGKSKSWVSAHAALLDWPVYIEELYSAGHCRDVTTLYSLIQLDKRAPERVRALCARGLPVARRDVAELDSLVSTLPREQGAWSVAGRGEAVEAKAPADPIKDRSTDAYSTVPVELPRDRLNNPVLVVSVDGKAGTLLPALRADAGSGWVRIHATGAEQLVSLASIRIEAIVDGEVLS